MGPHPAPRALVFAEEVCVRRGRDDVMHYRVRRVGEHRAVQVREQGGILAERRRQDCQVIHVVSRPAEWDERKPRVRREAVPEPSERVARRTPQRRWAQQ
jgi:hypothetical protein